MRDTEKILAVCAIAFALALGSFKFGEMEERSLSRARQRLAFCEGCQAGANVTADIVVQGIEAGKFPNGALSASNFWTAVYNLHPQYKP